MADEEEKEKSDEENGLCIYCKGGSTIHCGGQCSCTVCG